MKTAKILAATVLGLAVSAGASITGDVLASRDPRTAAVRPGVWHADLNKAREYAAANGLPLVAVWSNGDECAHCVAFENCIRSPAFLNWMKDSGIVWYFGERNDGLGHDSASADGQEGYHGTSFYWCCNYQNATMNWPYVRVWWPKAGLDVIHSGSWFDGEDLGKVMRCSYTDNRTDAANFIAPGDYGTYNPGGRRIISVLVGTQIATAVMPVGGGIATGGLLNGFDPNTYAGGEFGFTYHASYPDGGIQVEYGTDLTELVVPLTRNNASARTKAAYNWLRTVYPNGHAETNRVDWAAGVAETNAFVNLNKAWLEGEAKTVTLELYSDKVELQETSAVWCVEKVPNSPANPLFVGERTKDTLQWGEWTMDVSAAMQKVQEAGGSAANAYVLVVCGGALWCPDCVNTDKFLFDRDEFKTWATNSHKVALVAIDIPNMNASNPDGTSACLLTSTIGKVSSGYLSAAGKDSTGTYQCGVNYQSRHGVTLAQAASIYARNKSYAAGILNKLVPSNPYRPGVPTIYALRPDGTVAGRIAEFASTSPKDWNANYLTRLDELLALVDDANEERGNGLCGDRNPVISGSSKRGVSGTLSLADATDAYRLSSQKDSELMLTVSGPDAAKVSVTVLDGGDDVVVATAAGSLAGGLALSCTVPSTNCYIRISTADADYFKAAKDGSTVAAYTLRTDSIIAPGETYDETEPIDCSGGGCADLGDASTNVWIKLEQGVQYKFTGLADANADNEAALDYNAADDVYTAKVSGDTRLVLAPDGDGLVVFGYQRWAPGVVEFYPKAQTVRERGDTEGYDYLYTIRVRRAGGVSGPACAEIYLVDDDKKSTRPADAYVWNDDGRRFFWVEGDDGEQTATVRIKADTHADGTTKLTFRLREVEDEEGVDAAVSEEEFVLTIIDEDDADSGRAALVTADGRDIPASRSVYVKGGTKDFALGLSRVDGADGPLSVKVVEGKTNELAVAEWAPREGTEKSQTVTFDIPAYVEGGSNRMNIAIVGDTGAKVVPSAKYLTINIIPDDAAMFESPAVAFDDFTRYVGHGDVSVELDGGTISGTDVEVVKLSGSIAPGLVWSGTVGGSNCDPGTPGLKISGTPTKGGTYTAVFQVVQDGVPGGTVQVSMTVADPVEASGEDGAAKNPKLAVTRTVPDVMVVDVEKERLIGLLTVTVPRSGRLSGKYRSIDGTTVSLLSTEWSSCTEDGDFTASLVGVQDETCTATVTARADGAITIDAFEDPDANVAKAACLPRNSLWDEGDGATAWEGYYTVSLPFKTQLEKSAAFANGDGYVTLRMNDKASVAGGRMVYAGILANGKAFSGVATLEALSDKVALLPVFSLSESDTVTGVFRVDRTKTFREVEACESAYPYWRHAELRAEASYSGKLQAYGCLYRQNSILQCCTNTFATQYLTFFALPGDLVTDARFGLQAPYGLAWSTNDIYSVAVKVSNEGGHDNITLYSPDRARQVHGLTLNFNPATGLFSGQLWLDFQSSATDGARVTATYRGIVKPGWGKVPNECNTCLDVPTPEEAPFISGTCFFSDTFEYEHNMRTRWLQIKRGCPFSIGVEEGQ